AWTVSSWRAGVGHWPFSGWHYRIRHQPRARFGTTHRARRAADRGKRRVGLELCGDTSFRPVSRRWDCRIANSLDPILTLRPNARIMWRPNAISIVGNTKP